MPRKCIATIAFILLLQGICLAQGTTNNQNFAFRLFKSYNKFIIKNNTKENFFLTPFRVGQDFAFMGMGSRGNTNKSIYKAIAPALTTNKTHNYYLDNSLSANNYNKTHSVFLLDRLDELDKYQGDYNFNPITFEEFNITNKTKYKFINTSREHHPMSVISQSKYSLTLNNNIQKYYKTNNWEALLPKCTNNLCALIINFPEKEEKKSIFNVLSFFEKSPKDNYFSFVNKLNKKFFQLEILEKLEDSNFSFHLPKTNIISQERLSQPLSNSGLSLVFSSPADFSDFECNTHLKLAEFYHNNKLQINTLHPNNSQINITNQQPYLIILYTKEQLDILGIAAHLPLETKNHKK